MLTKMLQSYKPFLDKPIPERTILIKLAQTFEDSTDNLFLSPEELPTFTSIGTAQQWDELLKLEPTQNYIKSQMTNMAQVASRKAFQALSQKASSGDTQAAKQVNEIAGLLNKADNNRTVVLTVVPRPQSIS